MSYQSVVPAIIPASEAEVVRYAQALTFARELQLDLVDGQFVSSVSWPYEPVGSPAAVREVVSGYTLEVDLMVADPLAAAALWADAGADMLVFHVETLSLEQFKQFADITTVSVGVSAHGATTLETLLTYAEYADYIQLMGIYEIGAQGLPFDEAVLDKARAIKKQLPNVLLSVDGSVNTKTIERLHEAGVDRFVCGSAIVKQENPEAAYQALLSLVN